MVVGSVAELGGLVGGAICPVRVAVTASGEIVTSELFNKRWGEARTFLLRAAQHPSAVGAVAPSSVGLARMMASIVPTEPAPGRSAPVVVELGPGTGALSAEITPRLPDEGRHIAIESDEGMVEHLTSRASRMEVVHGDAAQVRELLEGIGVTSVDAVICGLPWAIFPDATQRDIVNSIAEVLAPGAAFATFAYAHALRMSRARAFRGRIEAAFDEVVMTRTVWRNLPPARVYVCRRPRGLR